MSISDPSSSAPEKNSNRQHFLGEFLTQFALVGGRYLAIAVSICFFLLVLNAIEVTPPPEASRGSILHHLSRATEISFAGTTLKLANGETIPIQKALSDQQESINKRFSELEERLRKINPDNNRALVQAADSLSKAEITSAGIDANINKNVSGAIWIGNAVNGNYTFKISKTDHSAFSSLREIKKGEKIRAATALRIRQALPYDIKSGYFTGIKEAGVLFEGDEATIQGSPKAYRLPNGVKQYWVEVSR